MPFICTWRKNLGGFFLVDSFKREIKYKSLHISGYSVLWYCCSVIYMSLLKPGVLSLLSHLGREQSQFHLLAQRREISIIFVGVGNRALSLITSVVEHGWRKEALTLLFSGHHNWPPSWDGHWPGSSLRHTKSPGTPTSAQSECPPQHRVCFDSHSSVVMDGKLLKKWRISLGERMAGTVLNQGGHSMKQQK